MSTVVPAAAGPPTDPGPTPRSGPIDVAVVGLGFGAEFVPLYASHPDVGRVGIVEPNPDLRAQVGDRLGVPDRFASIDALLATEQWDAVHVLAPVAFHAAQTIAVLESGRHCMCAVPMATELADLQAIIDAAHRSGRTYMMAETSVYAREFFYAKDLLDRGDLGELTFYRGAHIQDLDSYADYWQGYPPMKYLTHALSPALALADTRVRAVHSLGSGRLPRPGGFDNPYPVETGIFALERDGLAAHITVSFFATAHTFYEGFSVYGTAGSIEWPQLSGPPVTYRFADRASDQSSRPVRVDHVDPPDRPELLPPALVPYLRTTSYQPPGGLPAIRFGGGHGGSHPHLVHEFVRSIVEGREPAIGPIRAADWTAPGICAHESAMHDGAAVQVPHFV